MKLSYIYLVAVIFQFNVAFAKTNDITNIITNYLSNTTSGGYRTIQESDSFLDQNVAQYYKLSDIFANPIHNQLVLIRGKLVQDLNNKGLFVFQDDNVIGNIEISPDLWKQINEKTYILNKNTQFLAKVNFNKENQSVLLQVIKIFQKPSSTENYILTTQDKELSKELDKKDNTPTNLKVNPILYSVDSKNPLPTNNTNPVNQPQTFSNNTQTTINNSSTPTNNTNNSASMPQVTNPNNQATTTPSTINNSSTPTNNTNNSASMPQATTPNNQATTAPNTLNNSSTTTNNTNNSASMPQATTPNNQPTNTPNTLNNNSTPTNNTNSSASMPQATNPNNQPTNTPNTLNNNSTPANNTNNSASMPQATTPNNQATTTPNTLNNSSTPTNNTNNSASMPQATNPNNQATTAPNTVKNNSANVSSTNKPSTPPAVIQNKVPIERTLQSKSEQQEDYNVLNPEELKKAERRDKLPPIRQKKNLFNFFKSPNHKG